MERLEALESGSIVMGGLSTAGIMQSIAALESGTSSKSPPYEYLIPDTSTRVINYITSTVHQHKFWNGLRNRDGNDD
jgi:UDP-N-acetylglucosamine 2-epimerase (non-hydrolysing)